MKKYKINNRLRRLIIALSVILLISLSFYDFTLYTSSLTPSIKQYQKTILSATLNTRGYLKPNPFVEGNLSYITVNTVSKVPVKVTTCAQLIPNILYNATVICNQSHYFVYITKMLYLRLNITKFNYSVYLSSPGYYTKLIITNTSENGIIPINISYFLNLNNKIDEEIGIDTTPSIVVKVGTYTEIFLNYSDNTIYVNVANNTYNVVFNQSKLVVLLVSNLTSYQSNLLEFLQVYLNITPRVNWTSEKYEIMVTEGNFSFTFYEGNLSVNGITLNISYIYNEAYSILQQYKIPINYQPNITIIFYYSNNNLTFTPTVIINNINGNIVTSISNNVVNTTTVKYVYHRFRTYELSDLAIPIIPLLFTIFLTENKALSNAAIVLKKLKKYKKMVITVTDPPNINNVVKVNNLDDIIKISLNSVKPILLIKGDKSISIWVIDNDIGYLYEVRDTDTK